MTQAAPNATWACRHTVDGTSGDGNITFMIEYQDLAGHDAEGTLTQANLTAGSGIRVDQTAPNMTSLTMASSNAEGSVAVRGDTVTVTLTASESLRPPSCIMRVGAEAVAVEVAAVVGLSVGLSGELAQAVSVGLVSTVAGSGSWGWTDAVGTNARFNYPRGIAVAPDGSFALVVDSNNHRIRKIDLETRVVSTLAGRS